MASVADRIARAAAEAIHNLAPTKLFANQVASRVPDGLGGPTNPYPVDERCPFDPKKCGRDARYPLLTGLSDRVSDQFPTAVALTTDDRLAAADPKMGILQARS